MERWLLITHVVVLTVTGAFILHLLLEDHTCYHSLCCGEEVNAELDCWWCPGEVLLREVIRHIMAARAIHNIFKMCEFQLIITNSAIRFVCTVSSKTSFCGAFPILVLVWSVKRDCLVSEKWFWTDTYPEIASDSKSGRLQWRLDC